MPKWERLRRGKSAKHVTFCAQTTARLVRSDNSNNPLERAPSYNGRAASPQGVDCNITLNLVDPYGCLDVRRCPEYRRMHGTYLNRNVEVGQPLALFTRDYINAAQQHDGRDTTYMAQCTYQRANKTIKLIGDGIKGTAHGSYARDSTTHEHTNAEVKIRWRSGRPELVLVATKQIECGTEVVRDFGLEHYLYELRHLKRVRARLLLKYAPPLNETEAGSWLSEWLAARAHMVATPKQAYWCDERGRHPSGRRVDAAQEQEEQLDSIICNLEESTRRYEERLAQQAHLRVPAPSAPALPPVKTDWNELEKTGRKTTLYAVTDSNSRFDEDSVCALTDEIADLKVVTLNIRILADDKLDAIVLFIIRQEVDILFLQDTRASDCRSDHYAEQLQAKLYSKLNKIWTICKNPAAPIPQNGKHLMVGGQLAIIGHRMRPYLTKVKTDATQQGATMYLSFNLKLSQILVINTYWAPGGGSENSLLTRIKHSEVVQKSGLTALQYLQKEICDRMMTFMAENPNSNVLLTGDLNSRRCVNERGGSSHPPLQKWMDETGLQDPIGDHLADTKTHLNTCGMNGDMVSRIDHCLTMLTSARLVAYGVSTSPIWQEITDHLPLVAHLTVPNIKATQRGYHPKGHVHSLNAKALKEGDDIYEYQTVMEEVVSDLGPIPDTDVEKGYQLELLCRRTSAAVNRLHPPPTRRAHKQHWSIVLLALKAHLTFLGAVRRALQRTRHIGLTKDVTAQINKYSQDWNEAVLALGIEDQTQTNRLLNWTGYGPEYYMRLTTAETEIRSTHGFETARVAKQIKLVLSAMTTSKRKHYRRKFAKLAAEIEEERRCGKPGRVIKLLLQKRRNVFNMNLLELPNGTLELDIEKAQLVVTQELSKWMSGDEVHRQGINADDTDHDRVYRDEEYFRTLVAPKGIPDHLIQLIWKAVQSTRDKLDSPQGDGQTVRSKSSKWMETPPTYEQWTDICMHDARKGKASAMSGLTYNMVKLWPDVAMRRAYDLLLQMWNAEHTPAFHKLRWMCLIPKVPGSNKQADTRPISLLEVLRKLWNSFFMKKVNNFLTRHKVPNTAQCAYWAKMGTDTASLDLINALEAVRSVDGIIGVMSYDFTRAFDSVSRMLSRLALRRFGVSERLADYLVDQDVGGTVLIRSPLTLQLLGDLSKQAEALNTSIMDPRLRRHKFFRYVVEVQRGIAQGGVESCVIWNAVMDILLTTMEFVDDDPVLILGPDHQLRKLPPGCYADDLMAAATGSRGLQKLADVVSAFCMIFGFDIKVAKLRAFLLQWGHEQELERDPTVTLHLRNWNHTEVVKLAADGNFKFVGIMHNDLKNQMFKEMLAKVRMHTTYMKKTKGSIDGVLAACTMSVHSTVLYRATLGTWTIQQINELDNVLQSLYRKIYKMMPGYPGELIQLPHQWGGLGCQSLRKKLVGTKWSMIHRNETKRDVTSSLLMRGDQLAGTVRYPGQQAKILPGDGLWATTLLTDASRAGLTLHRGGSSLAGTTSAQIADTEVYGTHPDSEKAILRRFALSTIGDLTLVTKTGRRWNDDLRGLSLLIDDVMQMECPQDTMKLRPLQCWLVQEPTEAYVAEILGFQGEMVVIRKWVTLLRKRKLKGKLVIETGLIKHARTDKFHGKEMVIHPSSYTRGEGSNLAIPPAYILESKSRVIMSGDLRDRQHGLHRVIIGIIPEDNPTILEAEEQISELVERVADELRDLCGPWDIFVDGSHKLMGGPFTAVLFPEDGTVEAAASLVFVARHDNWTDRPIVVLSLQEGGLFKPTSAFPMELLALAVADHIIRKLTLDAVIFSDCTGALTAIREHGRLRYLAKKQNLLLLQQSRWLTSRMCYVRSHPERYSTERTVWTRHMWGNHYADRACAQDTSDHGQLRDVRYIGATVAEALQVFTGEDTLYWADSKGNPTLRGFDEVFDARILEEYVTKRDEYRKQRISTAPLRWSGPMRRSVHFAGECAETEHKNKGDKARMHRIIWDHYMHGGNKLKMGIGDGSCNLCKQQDSARHWIMDCPHPVAEASRQETQLQIDRHIATLPTDDEELRQFIIILAAYATLHEDSHMHRLGMIPHVRLAEMGEFLGLTEVTEERRQILHDGALALGVIMLEGVIADYTHKRSDGKRTALVHVAELRCKRRLRRDAAAKKAKEKKVKREKKPKVAKQLRMTDYLQLPHRAYGADLRNAGIAGAEDSRRMDAGIG